MEITKSNERSIIDAMHEISSERKMVHFGMTQFILLKKSNVTLLMLRKQKSMAENINVPRSVPAMSCIRDFFL